MGTAHGAGLAGRALHHLFRYDACPMYCFPQAIRRRDFGYRVFGNSRGLARPDTRSRARSHNRALRSGRSNLRYDFDRVFDKSAGTPRSSHRWDWPRSRITLAPGLEGLWLTPRRFLIMRLVGSAGELPLVLCRTCERSLFWLPYWPQSSSSARQAQHQNQRLNAWKWAGLEVRRVANAFPADFARAFARRPVHNVPLMQKARAPVCNLPRTRQQPNQKTIDSQYRSTRSQRRQLPIRGF